MLNLLPKLTGSSVVKTDRLPSKTGCKTRTIVPTETDQQIFYYNFLLEFSIEFPNLELFKFHYSTPCAQCAHDRPKKPPKGFIKCQKQLMDCKTRLRLYFI